MDVDRLDSTESTCLASKNWGNKQCFREDDRKRATRAKNIQETEYVQNT